MKNALILDADLAFAFWLGRGLDQVGYEAFPAKSVAEASALVDELRIGVDLLIVNPTLPDTAGFIEMVRQLNGRAKVVAFLSDQPQLVSPAVRIDVCCRKPERMDDSDRLQWVKRVEALLPVSLLNRTRSGAAIASGAPSEAEMGRLDWDSVPGVPRPILRLGGWLWDRYCGLPSGPAQMAEPDPPVDPPQQKDDSAVPEPPEGETKTKVDWKQWEGQIIDGQFQLQRHLGGNDQSAVFLTEQSGVAAAIKVVLADAVGGKMLLSQWRGAAKLSHPGLLQLFQTGSCQSGDGPLVYLVMEYAEENLAEVLLERPLTEGEAKEMLEPIVGTVGFLHRSRLAHGRLRPSNILVVNDRVKIASDWIRPAGEPSRSPETPDVYDPPESATGELLPPGDIWSLGVTLVEALTQHLPIRKGAKGKKVVLPKAFPGSFVKIARCCLQTDPKQRENIAGLEARIEKYTVGRRRGVVTTWRFAVPALALGVALSAVLTGPLHPHPPVSVPWLQHSKPQPAQQATQAAPATIVAPPPVTAPQAAPVPPAVSAKPPSSAVERHLVHQVLPDVAPSAQKTIQGTLMVSILTEIDSSGHVARADFDSRGPSKYFAGLAIEAAKGWRFAPLDPPEPDRSDEWILQFEFTSDGVKAHPYQRPNK